MKLLYTVGEGHVYVYTVHVGMYEANADKYSASISHAVFSTQCSPQHLFNSFFSALTKKETKLGANDVVILVIPIIK